MALLVLSVSSLPRSARILGALFQTNLSANMRPCASNCLSWSQVDTRGVWLALVPSYSSGSSRQALRLLPLRPCISLTMRDITAADL